MPLILAALALGSKICGSDLKIAQQPNFQSDPYIIESTTTTTPSSYRYPSSTEHQPPWRRTAETGRRFTSAGPTNHAMHTT
jgi:hypothetical protein